MSERKFLEAETYLETQYRNAFCLLINQREKTIEEKYFQGMSQNQRKPIMSVTKSIMSALIGIAIKEGFLKDEKEKVISFFPELQLVATNYLFSELTIRHLLTMQSGILWKNGARGQEVVMDQMCRYPDWGKFLTHLPVVPKHFETFQYNSGNSHLLSIILKKATNRSAREFANQYLFSKLGIDPVPPQKRKVSYQKGMKQVMEMMEQIDWIEDPQGNNLGGFGLSLSPRDLLKFGELYRNHGNFHGEQMIEKEYILRSIQDYGKSGYGYHWWTKKIGNANAYYAMGYGGQYVIILPEYEAVIVFLSNTSNANGYQLLEVVEKLILPYLE